MTSTYVRRGVKVYSSEISMMEEGPTQQSVEIRPIPFHIIFITGDPINSHFYNTGKNLVALQLKSLLYWLIIEATIF